MLEKKETIFALSTPTGKSALAVIRISGEKSYSLVEAFSSNMPKKANIATFNNLVTKKNEVFDNNKMDKFIFNSKPNLNQQIAISKNEKEIFINLFEKNKEINRTPEFIIINLKKEFLSNYKIDSELYCNYYKGEIYSLYYLKELLKCK